MLDAAWMSRIHPQLRDLVVLLVVAVIAAGCGGSTDPEVVAKAPEGASSPDPAGPSAEPSSATPGIVVDVAGAVRRPGVYRMSPGARVHEAIQAAGGARPGAALDGLNRAAVLVDGQQVLIGTVGVRDATAGPEAASGAASGGTKVNINSADVAGLDALPGIGQVTAERIVASRDEAGPFASIDDLDRVPGIGPATIESLRTVAST